VEHSLRFIQRHGLTYRFINSHYWDAGLASQQLAHVLKVPHVHTPHCGAPTVVTVHGGLCRALSFGRPALFADPFDREDLGITMAKVFRHPRLRARLSRMGAHKARSLFTGTGMAHQLVAAVEQRAAVEIRLDDHEWDEPANDGD
jgi:hypothetical protein